MRVIVINGIDADGRVQKWLEFATTEAAAGFLADHPGAELVETEANPAHLVKTGGTWNVAPRLSPRQQVLPYDGFENRFTEAEQDALAGFVYATDPATGRPVRTALLKAYNRAVASGHIDLDAPETAAFIDALVAGGVLGADTNPQTNARRAEILA